MSDQISTTDPNVINKLASDLEKAPEAEVKTVAPSNNEVSLPGGFIAGDGSLVKYAEVRELNGLDEEAISKSGGTGKALIAMLQRGLVALGTEKPTKDDLESLLSGDRDAILVGIRRATFGDTVDYNVTCASCLEQLKVTVNLATDIPVVTLDDPIEGRQFVYESKTKGEIVVSLPTGLTQKKLLENLDKTRAEVNTLVLADCVESVGGEPSVGVLSVQKLGMSDRENLVDEIIKRSPGPRLAEVKTTCEACGEEIPMPLSLADLFRL